LPFKYNVYLNRTVFFSKPGESFSVLIKKISNSFIIKNAQFSYLPMVQNASLLHELMELIDFYVNSLWIQATELDSRKFTDVFVGSKCNHYWGNKQSTAL